MAITAILVDGAFYRAKFEKNGVHQPCDAADALVRYCYRHLHEHSIEHTLYRIFYYDCPPSSKKTFHPLHNRSYDLSKSDRHNWMVSFLNELRKKRKVALRLGYLDEVNAEYTLRQSSAREIVLQKKSVEELTDSDFVPSFKQKGVDMRIGMDIASLSYKKQVNQIVLIAGDADFVPAAKLARREGIDFVLDPLGHPIKDDLFEHIDGKRSCGDPYQVARTKIKNKVSRSSN